MPNTTVQAAGEAMPHDMIMRIAKDLGVAERLREDYEAKARNKDDTISMTYKRDEEHASDLTYSLRQMLSHHKATSLDGAAVQIAEIINIVGLLWDGIPEEAMDYDLRHHRRAFDRLAYSVLDFLNVQLATPVEALVYRHFANQHINPWTPTPERLVTRGVTKEAADA